MRIWMQGFYCYLVQVPLLLVPPSWLGRPKKDLNFHSQHTCTRYFIYTSAYGPTRLGNFGILPHQPANPAYAAFCTQR